MTAFKFQLLGLALILIAHAGALTTSSRLNEKRRVCPPYTKLLPRYAEYSKHCEAESGPTGSDPKWPCFTLWSRDLSGVVADAADPKADPDQILLIKDGFKQDFTLRDPKTPFSLTWDSQATLIYNGYNPTTGCYKIQLTRNADTTLRIWVSDETNKERNVDNLHYTSTEPVEICTKWAHIHVKYDGNEW